jgi:hypothetical protein
VTPEQESHRIRESQDLLKRLSILLTEGDAPAVDIISETLVKAELMVAEASRNPTDPQTRRTLEDINALLASARQLGRNKGIADRLQRISIESEKALKENRGPGVSEMTKEANQNVVEFMNNWRPLFILMTGSREFRQLLLDGIRISRNVIYSYGYDISHETGQKFVEGASAKDIAVTAKDMAQRTGTPELSEEEWNVLQDDVQMLLVILAREPKYREGIERIFSLLDQFQRGIGQIPDPAAAAPQDIHLRRVVAETEDLVASFSGRDTLERFKYHLRNLILLIQRNPKLHAYLMELKVFILKAKSEDEVRSEAFKHQSRDLAYRGREYMRELREHDDMEQFLNSGSDLIDNIKNDEFLQVLRQHAGVVQSDLSYTDTQGNLKVDTDMLSKLQTAILPVLAESLKYIPIPKIHSEDKTQEFWLDNVVLCSYDILPENIRFHLESDTEISIRDIELKNTFTYLVISLKQLRTELKDLEFFYKKKTFPTFEERGRVTFRIKGAEGGRLVFTYKLAQDQNDTTPRIKEGYASFDISDMSIEFDKKSLNHPVMMPMMTKIFKTQIRRMIEKQVEENLNTYMEKLGTLITSSITQMNRPFLSGIEKARQAVKNIQLSQIYEQRKEIME